MKSILDPTFRYTSSLNTDIRKTFARVRREYEHGNAPIAPLRLPENGRGRVASIEGRTAWGSTRTASDRSGRVPQGGPRSAWK
jgi:hypothetical protein